MGEDRGGGELAGLSLADRVARMRAAWEALGGEAAPEPESGGFSRMTEGEVARQRDEYRRLVIEASGIPGRLLASASWDELSPDEDAARRLKAMAGRYLADDPMRNLIIIGAVGVGKTMFAALLFGELARRFEHRSWRNPPILWRHAETLQNQLKSDEVVDAKIVVVDDLGAESQPAEWYRGRIECWFNDRLARGVPTIITTNRRNREGLESRYGSPMLSRLFDRSATRAIEWPTNQDRRLQDGQTRYR